ncbi:MAG: rhodanese-like domain-containing protein [Verrucomicrobiota bacterium]
MVATLVLAAAASAAQFSDISITELKSAIETKKVVLLDANGTTSYQSGHIPGAIDYTAVKKDLAKVLPKDKNALVVAYCGGPACGAYQAAAKAAKDLGYKNVKHLAAGISGWKEAKETIEKAN